MSVLKNTSSKIKGVIFIQKKTLSQLLVPFTIFVEHKHVERCLHQLDKKMKYYS